MQAIVKSAAQYTRRYQILTPLEIRGSYFFDLSDLGPQISDPSIETGHGRFIRGFFCAKLLNVRVSYDSVGRTWTSSFSADSVQTED